MELDINNIPNHISDALQLLNYPTDEKDFNRTVFINLDKAIALYVTQLNIMHQHKLDMLQYVHSTTGIWEDFNPSSRNDLDYMFFRVLKYPKEAFYYDGKVSFSGSTIKGLPTELKNQFTSALIGHIEAESRKSNLKPYATLQYTGAPIYNNEGDRLAVIKPKYRFSETFRKQSHNPNIQGLGKEDSSIVTAPEGYVVVQVDSRQIEPCIYYSTIVKDPMISWLIEQHDDVYFALADYCMRDSIEFTPSNLFTMERIGRTERDALKTLVNAGTYGSSRQKVRNLAINIFRGAHLDSSEGAELKGLLSMRYQYISAIDNPRIPEKHKTKHREKLVYIDSELDKINQKAEVLVTRFFNRVIGHPQRVQFEKEIDKSIRMGVREVTSPFGDSRTVFGSVQHIKNCFLNNPLQMAVSRLSAISVYKAFEYINSSELMKQKVIYAFHKHDEDIFYVRKDAIDEVVPVLKDLRSYYINGWVPIKSEVKVNLDYLK